MSVSEMQVKFGDQPVDLPSTLVAWRRCLHGYANSRMRTLSVERFLPHLAFLVSESYGIIAMVGSLGPGEAEPWKSQPR